MNVLYARNEFKGVLIRCPHCTFSSRHDPDDIGDAIKEGKPVVCGACEKPFHVFVSVAPREAVEHGVQRTICTVCNDFGSVTIDGKYFPYCPACGGTVQSR